MINFLVPEYHYVYWIRLTEETDKQNGYIGVTRDIRKRINQHLAKKTGATGEFDSQVSNIIADLPLGAFCVDVIFTGTRQECLDMEQELRPHNNIGWNTNKGGGCTYSNNNTTKRVVSQETRDKLSKANKGVKRTNPSWAKGLKRWSKEDKERIGNQHRGKVISEEQKKKFRETVKWSNKNGKHIALKYKDKEITCVFDSIQKATRFLQDEGIAIGESTIKSAARRRGVNFRATNDWTIDYETSHPLLGAKDLVDLSNKKAHRIEYETGESAQKAYGKPVEIFHKNTPEEIIKCHSTKVAGEYFGISGSGLRAFIEKNGLMSYHHTGYAVKSYTKDNK